MAKKSKILKKTKESSKKGLLYIQHTADPLFTSISHPTEPIIVTGSATGRVQAYKYNVDELREVRKDFDGLPYVISNLQKDDFLEDTIDLLWSTKRHKGSCRGLCFDLESNGKKLYSIGSDGVVKMSDVETGKVLSKYINEEVKFTKCISPPGKPYLVVGDEIGNIYCHDTRQKDLKLCHEPIRRLHNGEGINGISYCWPKSDYKFITMGSTTVCEIDLRKPEKAVRESEDQEDEVVCGVFVDQQKQDLMVCGMGEGVVTTWKPELNQWEDQVNRIKVTKDETIDSIISAMDGDGKFVYAGSGDGSVNKIDVIEGRCVEHLFNRDPEKEGNVVDEVTILDLDHGYRLVSGGMDGLTIWDEEEGEDEDEDESEEDINDSDSGSDNGSDSDSDGDSEISADALINSAESEVEEEPVVEERRSVKESMKRRFEQVTKPESASEDERFVEVSDSDDDISETVQSTVRETVPLGEIRDKILGEITEAYKTDDQPLQLSKRQMKKMKVLKAPGPEHGIFKFDDL